MLPASYMFEDGRMVILQGAVELSRQATYAFLMLANLLAVYVGNRLVGRHVQALLVAERELFQQAWNFQRLFPGVTLLNR